MSIFWATGAAMFVRREAWEKAGGLDESFFAHMEEIDLCWRMKNIGYKIYVEPKSYVYHVGGGTLNKINPKKTYLNFRNNFILNCL
jgi:GT2 family glycosyltransferase